MPRPIKITQMNKWYKVELDSEKYHMLNQRSLVYFLKEQLGFDCAARASIVHMLENETVVEFDLEQSTATKAA